MASYKLEEHIKTKLEERKLSVSTDAWEVLQKRLDDTNKSKTNRKGFWWLGIAASLVGVLIMVNMLTKTDNQIVEPTLVETDALEELKDEQVVESKMEVDNAVENRKQQPENANEPSVVVIQESKMVKQTEEQVVINNIPEIKVSVVQRGEFIETNKLEESQPKEVVSLEDQKVKDVVAKILELQQSNEVVTDTQIDSMLNAAQMELQKQRIYNENTNKVDAMALLQDVEFELEKSFRDKVFEALSSSYKSVKTAVVERNN